MNGIIAELINQGRFFDARNEIIKMNVVDIAQLFEDIEDDNVLMVFRLLPKDIAVEVFSYMSYEQQQFIIESITDKEIKYIIDELFLDDTVELIEEMPANIVKKILKNANESTRKQINHLLMYPDNSAGSIMTIEYVDLKKEMALSEALEHIKRTGVDKETIDVCYVIDNNRKLEGSVPIRKLILNDENVKVADVMDINVVSVNTHVDQEEIASLFKKYDLVAMPVVDNENRLVGIITIDDIMDVIEQENTEDFHKMAAIAPSEEGYMKSGVIVLAKRRIFWLLILMISATITGRIIIKYESLLQSVVALTAFIPMLMDTGGNAGSQASTLIIRGLALGEIKLNDMLKIIWKEFRVSILVGIILAAVNFVRLYFLVKTDIIITAIICISLVVTVMLAKVIGCTLPVVAKSLKLDPAIMASPIITTVVDSLALIAYFNVASWLLGLR
jgi:magnesium transporter